MISTCDCPTGYQWNTGTNQCVCQLPRVLRRFHHWWRHSCAAGSCDGLRGVQCPAGESRAAGDAVLGGDTTCDLCAANYRASSGSCVACATGYANAALDSKSSLTTCDLCAADYYVASISTCTACPTGTTNVAGDVNTGSVTDCDCPTGSSWNAGTSSCDCPSNSAWDSVGGQCECDAGFRVDSSNNACVACATGYTNAAGDVVAGSRDRHAVDRRPTTACPRARARRARPAT